MGTDGGDGSSNSNGWMSMKALGSKKPAIDKDSSTAKKNSQQPDTGARVDRLDLEEVTSNDGLLNEEEDRVVARRVQGNGVSGGSVGSGIVAYKVYKRRFFGLFQLALLNIIVSWDWLSWAALSTTSSQYYNVSTDAINWLSTGFLFAFVVASPITILTLHRGGPRRAILAASILLLLGNWIRYGGTKANNFGVVMFGQVLTGLAQPFVLSAPTRYSDLWFTGQGRVAATALMTLANPFGGALGQLIDPFWVSVPSDVPNMVLYISILSSVATIPSFFIPSAPPTPCSQSSSAPKQPIGPSLKALFTLPEFYMIFLPFCVYVGLFNSISSIINQVLYPYNFTETQAGIAGALLIVVGLVTAAITSPIIDRSKAYLFAIKVQIPILAVCYLAFIWAPPTGTEAAVYTILALLGAASFSLVPVVLEYLCEITHPISPEITSTICWTGGQALGGVFIIISSDALTDGPDGGVGGRPPYSMQRALWFQAILAVVVVPLPLALGFFGRARSVRLRRVEVDEANAGVRSVGGEIQTGLP